MKTPSWNVWDVVTTIALIIAGKKQDATNPTSVAIDIRTLLTKKLLLSVFIHQTNVLSDLSPKILCPEMFESRDAMSPWPLETFALA